MATLTIPHPEIQAQRPACVANPPHEKRAHARNKNFDLLRILFAVLVMLAHAAELADGNNSREPLTRLFHVDMSLGGLAVDGFFLLSGYLIVQSWLASPKAGDFLKRRSLRIFPGYLVAVAFAILAGGLLAPGVPHYFQEYCARGGHYLRSIAFLSTPEAPPLYPRLNWHQVDGSMWTIAYEFRCYLAVLLLGVLGLAKRPRVWALLAMAVTLIETVPPLTRLLYWAPYSRFVGEPKQDWRLFSFFFFGACFFAFRARIRFRPVYAAAAVCLQSLTLLHRPLFEPALGLFGAYLLFYAGQVPLRLPALLQNMPDISYGLYLYGAPVECLWISRFHGSPWVAFAVCTGFAAMLGWLSWTFVERPMLRFKPKRPQFSSAFHALSNASSPSSSSTLTPSAAALSSLDPASSPATT